MEVPQTAIGQRLKFLLEHFNMSARTFSRNIGVPENNTQNYLGPRGMLPKADYLEKVALHFQSINAYWLLTGEGEPFLLSAPTEANSVSSNRKISRSLVIGQQSGGSATQNHGSDAARGSIDTSNDKALIEQLRSQLADKERTIQILLNKL